MLMDMVNNADFEGNIKGLADLEGNKKVPMEDGWDDTVL